MEIFLNCECLGLAELSQFRNPRFNLKSHVSDILHAKFTHVHEDLISSNSRGDAYLQTGTIFMIHLQYVAVHKEL